MSESVCEVCRESGVRSAVRKVGNGQVTGEAVNFYDENGTHHVHLPARTRVMQCQNNHVWSVTFKRNECAVNPECTVPTPTFPSLLESKWPAKESPPSAATDTTGTDFAPTTIPVEQAVVDEHAARKSAAKDAAWVALMKQKHGDAWKPGLPLPRNEPVLIDSFEVVPDQTPLQPLMPKEVDEHAARKQAIKAAEWEAALAKKRAGKGPAELILKAKPAATLTPVLPEYMIVPTYAPDNDVSTANLI